MIIAIDGPAGAGKSTVATDVARRLGYQLIDTGALYRTVTYKALSAQIPFSDSSQLTDLINSLDFEFRWVDGKNKLYCGGIPIGDEIRREEVSRAASELAGIGAVREALLSIQRNLGRKAPSVMEGRDIGSVVFPNAKIKIYLDASSDIRARRRVAQANERGEVLDFEHVKAAIEARDHNDKTRKFAPLVCPEDAVVIDSSHLSIEDVVDTIVKIAKENNMLS